jgi:hypothetical protein
MTGHAWTVSSIAIRPHIPHTPLLLASGTAGTLHKAPQCFRSYWFLGRTPSSGSSIGDAEDALTGVDWLEGVISRAI